MAGGAYNRGDRTLVMADEKQYMSYRSVLLFGLDMKTQTQANKPPKPLYSLRKTPSQGRSKATVEAILQAAAQLLLSLGYDKTSTNKIAQLAGVSIGSLYEYFPAKEAIFAEIRRREAQRHYALVMAKPLPTTLREMLRLHLSTYIELVRTNVDLHAALISEVPHFAIVEASSEIFSDYMQFSIEFLSAHSGSLRPQRDVSMIVELMFRVVYSTIDDYALHAPDRLEDAAVADELLEMLELYLLR